MDKSISYTVYLKFTICFGITVFLLLKNPLFALTAPYLFSVQNSLSQANPFLGPSRYGYNFIDIKEAKNQTLQLKSFPSFFGYTQLGASYIIPTNIMHFGTNFSYAESPDIPYVSRGTNSRPVLESNFKHQLIQGKAYTAIPLITNNLVAGLELEILYEQLANDKETLIFGNTGLLFDILGNKDFILAVTLEHLQLSSLALNYSSFIKTDIHYKFANLGTSITLSTEQAKLNLGFIANKNLKVFSGYNYDYQAQSFTSLTLGCLLNLDILSLEYLYTQGLFQNWNPSEQVISLGFNLGTPLSFSLESAEQEKQQKINTQTQLLLKIKNKFKVVIAPFIRDVDPFIVSNLYQSIKEDDQLFLLDQKLVSTLLNNSTYIQSDFFDNQKLEKIASILTADLIIFIDTSGFGGNFILNTRIYVPAQHKWYVLSTYLNNESSNNLSVYFKNMLTTLTSKIKE